MLRRTPLGRNRARNTSPRCRLTTVTTIKIRGGRRRPSGCESIQFLGRIGVAEVGHLLSEALFSVVPSECYENNPLSLIESLSAGTPVVGAAIGGIPELIGEGDGLMFTPGDVGSLQQAMSAAASTAWDHDAIAARAAGAFSPDRHYRRLMEIYRSVMR